MNSCIFVVLMQVACIVLANPVKRDGVQYVPPQASEEVPLLILKLQPSSESEEAESIPVEFPFELAKSLDEIFNFNQNIKRAEDDSATCPNTDIIMNAEVATENPAIFENSREYGLDRKPRSEELKSQTSDESDKSVSMESDESVPFDIPDIQRDMKKLMDEKEQMRKKKFFYGTGKKTSENEIPRDSKENGRFYKETMVLEKVNGKPIEGTLTVEKYNGEDVVVEEQPAPFNSRILDILKKQLNA